MSVDAGDILPDMPGPAPMPEGGNFLSKKMGGLPIWAWGIVGIGGAVLGIFILPKFFGAGKSADTTGTLAGVDPTSADNLADPSTYNFGQPITTTPPPGGTTGTTITPPIAPPTITPKPITKTASKGTWVTVGHWPGPDSTLSDIAQRHYGSSTDWPKIYSANRAAIGPNPNIIQDGMKLWLPAL